MCTTALVQVDGVFPLHHIIIISNVSLSCKAFFARMRKVREIFTIMCYYISKNESFMKESLYGRKI